MYRLCLTVGRACYCQKLILYIVGIYATPSTSMLVLNLQLSSFSALKVVYFPRVVKVADVVSILRSNKHNGFPVSLASSLFSVCV